jgi:hypothetical protein
MLNYIRDLVRPICPHCAGKGGFMEGYYEQEFYGCRCCNPDEDNDEDPTRVRRWHSWMFRFSEWRDAKRIDRWIDQQMKNAL